MRQSGEAVSHRWRPWALIIRGGTGPFSDAPAEHMVQEMKQARLVDWS